jgi:hypothetical protein
MQSSWIGQAAFDVIRMLVNFMQHETRMSEKRQTGNKHSNNYIRFSAGGIQHADFMDYLFQRQLGTSGAMLHIP